MEERQRRPEAIAGPEAEPLRDPLSLGHDRRVQVHAALRVGGGAGGVEHKAVVVASHLGLRGQHRRVVDALGVRDEARFLRPDHDAAQVPRSRLRHHVGIERLGHEDPHAGVADHVLELAGLEPRVDGHGDRPQAHRPHLQRECIEGRVHQQPDAVALADAGAVEAARHLQRRLGELPIAGTLSREDDRIARRLRAQVDEPGKGLRQRLRCGACGRHGSLSITPSSTER